MTYLSNLAFAMLMFSSTINPFQGKELQEPPDMPQCLEKAIDQFKYSHTGPNEIWEWKVNGKRYYHFKSFKHDDQLFTKRCKMICSPDSGGGNPDGKCQQFKSDIEKKRVWRKPYTR